MRQRIDPDAKIDRFAVVPQEQSTACRRIAERDDLATGIDGDRFAGSSAWEIPKVGHHTETAEWDRT